MKQAATPFHEGELMVQERLGVREAIEPWAKKVVRPYLPDQHREFYSQLPFIVATSRDSQDRPWVTLLEGNPGFITSPDPTKLSLRTRVLPGDALESSLDAGSELGLLGIELDSRRRNRVNGTVADVNSNRLEFHVGQSFGNCPQYITPREWQTVEVAPNQTSSANYSALTEPMYTWIRQADTFFIGSGRKDDRNTAANGLDASHRGGPPGFVHVDNPNRLVFPDYSGNNHFNTLGNLVADSRVALLFVNFDTGSLLQITGSAEIDWDSEEVQKHPGAQRLVVVNIDAIVELTNVLSLRFSTPSSNKQELRLVDKKRESSDVMSFYFASKNGRELKAFKAGQHLPIEIVLEGQQEPLTRTYSLSNGPNRKLYRVSVKREENGLVSRYLHDSFNTGSTLTSQIPAGDFVISKTEKPVVLISGGIGLTPLVSMLHELTETASNRSITFVHGARNSRHHPLADEIRQLAKNHLNVVLKTAYSQPLPDDVAGKDFDIIGRLDKTTIKDLIHHKHAEFYLCGSPSFLNTITNALSFYGVASVNIRTEEF